jgi:hypothetical protein
VDHIIPERYANRIKELDRLKKMYSLPKSFKINGFENWVPTHGKYNSRKGVQLFDPSPAMVMIFSRVLKSAQKAERYAEQPACKVKLISFADMSRKERIAWLKDRLKDGTLTQSMLEALIGPVGVGVAAVAGAVLLPPVLLTQIAYGVAAACWYSRRLSVEATKKFDRLSRKLGEQRCERCTHIGPWDDSLCLNCGHLQPIRYVLTA